MKSVDGMAQHTTQAVTVELSYLLRQSHYHVLATDLTSMLRPTAESWSSLSYIAPGCER